MNHQPYWMVVATRDHVFSGVEQGIIRANHGKATPLRRMRPDDGALVYAPKPVFGSSDSCQRFVASGTIADELVYQVDLAADFGAFRRRISYEPVVETPIQPFIGQLSFIRGKQRWGYWFRFGGFGISQADYDWLHTTMTNHTHV